MERLFKFASREVFNFHLEIANGIGATGSDNTRMLSNRISKPFGALSSLFTAPSTSTVAASFRSFKSNFVFPSSNTHWRSPSLFRKTTNATSPISLMVWTAPFTFTVFPSKSPAKISLISTVSFLFTPVMNSIRLYAPFLSLFWELLGAGRNNHYNKWN